MIITAKSGKRENRSGVTRKHHNNKTLETYAGLLAIAASACRQRDIGHVVPGRSAPAGLISGRIHEIQDSFIRELLYSHHDTYTRERVPGSGGRATTQYNTSSGHFLYCMALFSRLGRWKVASSTPTRSGHASYASEGGTSRSMRSRRRRNASNTVSLHGSYPTLCALMLDSSRPMGQSASGEQPLVRARSWD